MKTAKLFLSPLRRAKSRRDSTLLTVCFSLRIFSLRAILLLALMFFFCANLSAQVTIGALEEPKSGAILDLNSTVKGGLLLSNVELLNLYTIPHTGTTPFPGVTAGNHGSVKAGFAGAIVYHTGENGFPAGVYLWNGENWSPAGEDCRALTDADLIFAGLPFAKANTATSFSVSSSLSDRCSEGETFTWSATGPGTATFTPLSGAATSAVFSQEGEYTVTVTAQNPYMATSITKSLTVTVNTDGSVPLALLDGVYGIVGPVCLDAKVKKQPSTQSDAAYNARVDAFASQADYTKTYRFIHNDIYSNLHLILLDPAGLVESMTVPDDAVPVMGAEKEKPFTLTFNPDIKNRVPSNGDSLTVKLIATYRNKTNSPKIAYLEIRVEDGTCICPAKIDAGTWLNFMCHNLGDDPVLDIISSSQLVTREHHGDWYRFGASQASMKNTPYNDTHKTWDNSYYFPTNLLDWPVNNDPCPAGWRLPVKEEWAGAISIVPDLEGTNPVNPPNNSIARIPNPWSSSGDEFSRLLKIGDYLYIPAAGTRNWSNGNLENRGNAIHYWSSSHLDYYHQGYYAGRTLYSGENGNVLGRSSRAWGCSVRCVAVE